MLRKPVLHSFWLSSCSWRVRAALAFKGVDYEYRAVDLLQGGHKAGSFGEKSPLRQLPVFEDADGTCITQSLAILEYVEEVYGGPALLPADAASRARVRELCNLITSGIQPLQNLGTLQHVGATFGPEHKGPWAKHWLVAGFAGLEKCLQRTAGRYCVGDSVTLADCCLLPQVKNAERFKLDLSDYPTVQRVADSIRQVEAFASSAPEKMPDAASDDPLTK